ncbi:hypothetical protein [Sporosarcina luteola]|nr:hypothetical protein [Sporosarcina luteola]MCM3709595.1 hypothetical protein [Sporosarcina luteola]
MFLPMVTDIGQFLQVIGRFQSDIGQLDKVIGHFLELIVISGPSTHCTSS